MLCIGFSHYTNGDVGFLSINNRNSSSAAINIMVRDLDVVLGMVVT